MSDNQTTKPRPHCNICGRFLSAEKWTDPETGKTLITGYKCRLVSSNGEGGYEHD